MNQKILKHFRSQVKYLNTYFCRDIDCDECPYNPKDDVGCGANKLLRAMEEMTGSKYLEKEGGSH